MVYIVRSCFLKLFHNAVNTFISSKNRFCNHQKNPFFKSLIKYNSVQMAEVSRVAMGMCVHTRVFVHTCVSVWSPEGCTLFSDLLRRDRRLFLSRKVENTLGSHLEDGWVVAGKYKLKLG